MGYNQTAVTVSESDGVAQLTVKIFMPHEDVPIDSEVFFSLVVNTSDGTATGLVYQFWNLVYVPTHLPDIVTNRSPCESL